MVNKTDVQIALGTTGSSATLKALKSVKDALVDIEKQTVKTAKAFDHLNSVQQKLQRAGGGNGALSTGSLRGSGGFGGSGAYTRFAFSEFGGYNFGRLVAQAGVAGLAFGALVGSVYVAMNALKSFGSFLLNDIIKPQMQLEKRSVQLSNRTKETTPGAIQEAARLNRLNYNMSFEDTLKTIEVYGARGGKGSWKDAPEISKFVAKYVTGTGEDPSKIAELLGGIRKPGESSTDVINKFLAIQPAMGINIDPEHFADVARRAKTIGNMFGGNNVEQLSMANILLQQASQGTGSPQQAVTGMQQFFKNILANKKAHPHFKKFLSMGEGGQEVINDPLALIKFITEKEKGKLTNLGKLGLTDTRSLMNFLRPLTGDLTTERKQAEEEGVKGKEIEKRALELWVAELEDAKSKTKSMADVEAAAAKVMATSDEKLESAFNKIKDTIANSPDFMKNVESIVDDFARNSDSIGKALADFASMLMQVIATISSALGIPESGSVVTTTDSETELTVKPTDILGTDITGYWRRGDSGGYEYIAGQPPKDGGSFQDVGDPFTSTKVPVWGPFVNPNSGSDLHWPGDLPQPNKSILDQFNMNNMFSTGIPHAFKIDNIPGSDIDNKKEAIESFGLVKESMGGLNTSSDKAAKSLERLSIFLDTRFGSGLPPPKPIGSN